jgi:iron complex transport system ATP-binding protein
MTVPLLTMAGVSVALGGKAVLHDVSLAVSGGELVAVVGPNGAGKTTLIRAAAGLVRAAGSISLGADALARLPLAERARRLAYLPQGHVVHWPLPAAEVVALGRLPRSAGADMSEADRTAVARAMTAIGIAEYGDRSVTSLSGGERARVAVARVMATEAPLILADEPTASLDPRYQLAVMAMLRRHAEIGGGVIAVLHDLALAARFANRLVLMADGRVVADGPVATVLTAPLMAATFGIDAEIAEVRGVPVVVPVAVTAR